MPYVSSMTETYGDIPNVSKDFTTLFEILNRQGSNFLLDAVAESAGRNAIKFKFDTIDRVTLFSSLTKHFREALLERL